jgi:hypothetical protein
MELVDRLLAILAGPNPRYATQQLMAAGHSEDEARGALNFARSAGFTESSGLGADRLASRQEARHGDRIGMRSKRRFASPRHGAAAISLTPPLGPRWPRWSGEVTVTRFPENSRSHMRERLDVIRSRGVERRRNSARSG